MNFQDNKAIYLQLADMLVLAILRGDYGDDARLPSVREFAAQAEVNANTAVRAYEWLQQSGIIYTRRGLGYFVSPGARQQVLRARRAEFVGERLPTLFATMRDLSVTMDDVAGAWSAWDAAQHQNAGQ